MVCSMSVELDPDIEDPRNALAAAFTLPEDISPELAVLHNDIVTKLTNEARSLPMNTIQRLLLERIAYFYIAMKQKELTTGFSMREQKEMMTFWLSMTQEFNKLLSASNDKARTTLLVEIKNVLVQSLHAVKDPDERRILSRTWNEMFAEMDL